MLVARGGASWGHCGTASPSPPLSSSSPGHGEEEEEEERHRWDLLPLQIPSSIKLYLVSALDSASILLVLRGTAVATSTAAASEMSLRRGSVLFISANESLSLRLASPDGMLLFRACCLL